MDRIVGDIEEGDINTIPTSDESGRTDETKVDKLVSLITKKQAEVHPSKSSSDFCISRVPENIREIDTKAYEPRVVSIGPFHHGNVSYKEMEAIKMRYLNKVVERSTRKGVPLKNYVQFLNDHETKIRESYSETIEMDSNEFLAMLLLDSCFIIELLLCFSGLVSTDVDFSILTSPMLWGDIHMDLILFENQIPFFVLEGLFSLAMTGLESIPLLSLAIDFFEDYNPQEKSATDIKLIKHFTDLILIFYRPMTPRGKAVETNEAGIKLKMSSSKCLPCIRFDDDMARGEAAEEYQLTKTITELDEAGMKFKINPSKCLLDINYNDGVLEIPCIRFDDNTPRIIRNVMALELCNYFKDSYMIDYLIFLDNLVNTPKDVDILVKRGIIDNWLGDSKQVVDIINTMNSDITVDDQNFHFSSICTQLNAYCKIPQHRWRATLIRQYFCSPWRTASTCAAIFLLMLTLIQTILSIRSATRGQ